MRGKSTSGGGSSKSGEEVDSYYRCEYGMSNGFPKKCYCGGDVIIYTSNSKVNPGRPFFRCASSRAPGHLFKWVEEGMYEEVKRILRMCANNDELMELNDGFLHLQTEMKKLKMMNMVLGGAVGVLALFVIYFKV